jgi:hypothetical protein
VELVLRGPSKSFAQYSLVPHFVLGFAKPVGTGPVRLVPGGTGPARYIRFPPQNRAYKFVGMVNRPVLPVTVRVFVIRGNRSAGGFVNPVGVVTVT